MRRASLRRVSATLTEELIGILTVQLVPELGQLSARRVVPLSEDSVLRLVIQQVVQELCRQRYQPSFYPLAVI